MSNSRAKGINRHTSALRVKCCLQNCLRDVNNTRRRHNVKLDVLRLFYLFGSWSIEALVFLISIVVNTHNIKFPLCLKRYNTINLYEKVNVQLIAFLILVADKGMWSASRSCLFISDWKSTRTNWTDSCVAPATSLGSQEKGESGTENEYIRCFSEVPGHNPEIWTVMSDVKYKLSYRNKV